MCVSKWMCRFHKSFFAQVFMILNFRFQILYVSAVSEPCPLCCVFVVVFLHSTHLCVSLPSSAFPPLFFSVICLCRFFSASATCVVAMFLCLYISEHLLFQQGPHGLKCQSKQLPDKCIVQQACVSPPPIPPLLVL